MISQNCPKCASDRVRRGYRPTPIWSKLLFRYNLLCDNCNWEFTGFAVPGTVSSKPSRRPKRPIEEIAANKNVNNSGGDNNNGNSNSGKQRLNINEGVAHGKRIL